MLKNVREYFTECRQRVCYKTKMNAMLRKPGRNHEKKSYAFQKRWRASTHAN